MGIKEAGKYIKKLHKNQDNPYLWPDFLTGLPDKAAIIKKLEQIFPDLGKYSIAYVRISNIHPYLLKYGDKRHADIIQWAAAILQTTSEKCTQSFVGTLSTHDFIVICKTKNIMNTVKEAVKLFKKRVNTYYTKEDLKKKTTLSFMRSSKERVDIGLMKFVSVIVDRRLPVKRNRLIQEMGRVCAAMEDSDKEIIVLTNNMLSKYK